MKDYLWLNMRDLPYFRALLRAVEARFYQDFNLPRPMLDLGCGDGHFASLTFDQPPDVGLDPWAPPLHEAAQRKFYPLAVQGLGDRMPFPDGYFSSAVSNSVLEHIEDIDVVLREMGRVMRPGGIFLFCVPNHNFDPNLSIARFLDRVGLKGLASAYRRFFDKIARHKHLDSPEIWQGRLERAGFRVEKWWHYFSPSALAILEWGHYFGLPSLISRRLTGQWILSQTRWNLAFTRRMIEKYYTEVPEHPQGTCTFFVAIRQ